MLSIFCMYSSHHSWVACVLSFHMKNCVPAYQHTASRPTYPLGAGAELKGDVVVGLREIYIALARFI